MFAPQQINIRKSTPLAKHGGVAAKAWAVSKSALA